MHLGIMIDDALSSPLDRNARMIGYYIFVHSYLSIKELICLCQTNVQKYNYQMQNFERQINLQKFETGMQEKNNNKNNNEMVK